MKEEPTEQQEVFRSDSRISSFTIKQQNNRNTVTWSSLCWLLSECRMSARCFYCLYRVFTFYFLPLRIPSEHLWPLTSIMTSTSVTKIGGVVVVTQVIPQDEKSIPLQSPANTAETPPTATQAPPPARKAPPAAPTKMDDMTSIFMKAGPQCLGVRHADDVFNVIYWMSVNEVQLLIWDLLLVLLRVTTRSNHITQTWNTVWFKDVSWPLWLYW